MIGDVKFLSIDDLKTEHVVEYLSRVWIEIGVKWNNHQPLSQAVGEMT